MEAAWRLRREEDLVEPAARGSGGTEEDREERRIWMANAETAVSSPARPHLWADGQFHILEMQTSKPPPSPTTRCCSPLLMCVKIAFCSH